MKQPSFKPERDAWGTIRGYIYQVDLTIQRWLELQPDSQLELERGEDVDTIHRAMKIEQVPVPEFLDTNQGPVRYSMKDARNSDRHRDVKL